MHEHVPMYLEVLPCRIVADPGVVVNDMIGILRRCGGADFVGFVHWNAIILQKNFATVSM